MNARMRFVSREVIIYSLFTIHYSLFTIRYFRFKTSRLPACR